mmetsp:Transcript_18810/g.36882  ORF Transcript_18810/g.36882 Transcript_18810/m.36882 type:complete len:102 (+) Transcript_18810:191-496(+)
MPSALFKKAASKKGSKSRADTEAPATSSPARSPLAATLVLTGPDPESLEVSSDNPLMQRSQSEPSGDEKSSGWSKYLPTWRPKSSSRSSRERVPSSGTRTR